MEYKQIHIKAGLAKPVKILYMTDIHLTQADGSDTLRLTEHAQKRTEVFRKEANYPEKTPSEFFEEGLAYGAAHCDVTVITGDVFDFLSKANFAEAKRIMDPYDYMFAAGNHEFCPGWEFRSARRSEPSSMRMYNRILKEICILTIVR